MNVIMSPRSLLAVVLHCTWICGAFTAEQVCISPLGMESGDISRDQITVSSCTNGCAGLASFGRLHGNTSWYPDKYENPGRGEWIEVDLFEMKNVTGILTQGHRRSNTTYFVTSYKIQTSDKTTSEERTTYKNSSHPKEDAIFAGNTDADTVKRNLLDPPIMARYIRVVPWTWSPNGVSLRLELLGCSQDLMEDLTTPVGMTTGRTTHIRTTHRSTPIPVSSNTTGQKSQPTTVVPTEQTESSKLRHSSFPLGAVIGVTIGGVLGLILLIVLSVVIVKRRMSARDKYPVFTNPIYNKTTRPLDSNRNQPRSAPGSPEEMEEFVVNHTYKGPRPTGAGEPLQTNTAEESENVQINRYDPPDTS